MSLSKRVAGLAAALVGTSISFGSSSCGAEPSSDSTDLRQRMVREQIEARDVRDPRVLAAMRAVPRHLFVPEAQVPHAYRDSPLPIGHGQTISQPFIVASMTELLDIQPDDVVLEIGTGSGYQAAVLGRLAKQVYSIEVVEALATTARDRLRELGYDNIEVIAGDGYLGLPEHAPFDGIIVTAAPETVPPPLVEQLAVGARLVIPVGDRNQELRVIERTRTGISERSTYPVRFVPLVRKPEDLREPD